MAYQTRFFKAQVWYTQNRTPKNINTWSEPFNVAPNTLLSDVLPRVQADADGDAYVVWHEIFDVNDDAFLKEYRIYRRKAEESDAQLVPIATLDLATFSYKDANLSTKQKYAYTVGVVDREGLEKRSETAVEK